MLIALILALANSLTSSISLKGSRKLTWIAFFLRIATSSILGLFIRQIISAVDNDLDRSVDTAAPTCRYRSSDKNIFEPISLSITTSIPKSINFLATSGKMVARISVPSSFGKNICIFSNYVGNLESSAHSLIKKLNKEHEKFRSRRS